MDSETALSVNQRNATQAFGQRLERLLEISRTLSPVREPGLPRPALISAAALHIPPVARWRTYSNWMRAEISCVFWPRAPSGNRDYHARSISIKRVVASCWKRDYHAPCWNRDYHAGASGPPRAGNGTTESVEGKGSNITFLLPINSDQADAAGEVFIS